MKSIFLSHSFADKKIVRRLAGDLQEANVSVWIDEAELLVGDSLIDKISEAINDVDYLGVVLSKESVESEWVRREVEIALSQEISGKKVKVIPILKETCDIPPFLKGKLYADISDEKKYKKGVSDILRRLGADSGPRPDAL